MHLEADLTKIKGVGPALYERFKSLELTIVEDLLYFFPRKYEDFSQITPIVRLKPGKVTVKGTVESIVGRYIRRRLHITEAVIADGTAKVRGVWFNQPYRPTQMLKGQEYFFSGTYDFQRNRYVLSNPASELAGNFGVSTARIVPIYPESKGLKSQHIRRILRELLPLMSVLPETLPPELCKEYKLLPIGEALTNIHFPETTQKLALAKQRIAFEELLWLMTASYLNKLENSKLRSWPIAFKKAQARTFSAALPFTMTGAQKRAAWEIMQDIEKPQPMNRLVQGDVGSGKTVVGAMAAFMAAQAG
ncbi:MAG TPA: hypothetical protein VFT87_06040, partial [Candidatus Saccharimonadales bacterium]|nr:hypothetical protein [Candidatus Saccharimonadales bacterium]